jgi:hypothetical protein
MVARHLWLMNYLDCKLDAMGTNQHLKTLVKVFYKVCKEDLEIKRPLTKERKKVVVLDFQEPSYYIELQVAWDSK